MHLVLNNGLFGENIKKISESYLMIHNTPRSNDDALKWYRPWREHRIRRLQRAAHAIYCSGVFKMLLQNCVCTHCFRKVFVYYKCMQLALRYDTYSHNTT